MATIAGKKRQTTTAKQIEKTTAAMRKGRERSSQYFLQTQCNQCDPPRWVRNRELSEHRENYHRAGGYQFELRKEREKARKDAEKAQAEAAKQVAKAPPQRPERQPSKTKPTAAQAFKSKEHKTVAGSNGSQSWVSPLASRDSNGQGSAAATSMTEAIVEMFRGWAMQVPPSIPASRIDAQAAADMWRGIADALRMRVRAEQETNNIPETVLEPLLQAAQVASQIGDNHQEVVRRVQIKYGEVADVLSRPDTPDHTYLAGGK